MGPPPRLTLATAGCLLQASQLREVIVAALWAVPMSSAVQTFCRGRNFAVRTQELRPGAGKTGTPLDFFVYSRHYTVSCVVMYCLEKFWFVLSFVLCLRVVWLLSQRKRCCKRSCHVSSQFPTFLEELTAGARERAFTRHFLGPWPSVLMASQEAQARLAAGSFSCLLFALPFLSIFVYPIICLGSSNSPPLCSNFFFSLGATLEPLLWRDSGNMLLLMLPSAKASSPYPPALAALPCALLHSGVVATAESADSKNDKGCY